MFRKPPLMDCNVGGVDLSPLVSSFWVWGKLKIPFFNYFIRDRHHSAAPPQLKQIRGSLFPRFSAQQFGLFEHKKGAFRFSQGRALIATPLFFVPALAECFPLSSLPVLILDRYGSPRFSFRLTDSLSAQRPRLRTCCFSRTVQRHKV